MHGNRRQRKYERVQFHGNGGCPLTIPDQPSSQTVAQGQDATFTLTATNECGGGANYQWRWNGNEISGATDSAYTRTNAQCADAGGFDVVPVANQAGSQTSAVASLTVVAPPVILSGPAGQTVSLGEDAIFCLSATNACGGQLVYQWRFNGVEVPGATTNCYAFTVLQLTNAGNYDVVVSNLAAAVTSPAAFLTVAGPYLRFTLGSPYKLTAEGLTSCSCFRISPG